MSSRFIISMAVWHPRMSGCGPGTIVYLCPLIGNRYQLVLYPTMGFTDIIDGSHAKDKPVNCSFSGLWGKFVCFNLNSYGICFK